MTSKNSFILFFLFLSLSQLQGCDFSKTQFEFNRANRAEKNKDYLTAAKYFIRVVKRSDNLSLRIQAAQKSARIFNTELRQYDKAIELYRFIVINSKDKNEVSIAGKNIAEITFERLQDYQQAIIEYSRLISLPFSEEEKTDFHIKIAKSYFNLNKFFQAEIESDEILKRDLDKETRFQMLLFQANILLTRKQHAKAIAFFKSIISEFPIRSIKDNVQINLSVCYEELKDFDSAINILEEAKKSYPDPEFLDQKIARLQGRKKNLPGARGKVR